MCLTLPDESDRRLHGLVNLLSIDDLEVPGIPVQVPEDRLDPMLVPDEDAPGQPLLLRHGGSFQGHLVLGGSDGNDAGREGSGLRPKILERLKGTAGKGAGKCYRGRVHL
jgi:hypothetical protein